MKRRVLFSVTLLFLFLFTSCNGFFSNAETGVSVRLPGGNSKRALTEDGVTEYYFKVKCENTTDNTIIIEYGKTGDVILFDDLIPGDYTISGEAFSDEERTLLLYSGSIDAVVISEEVTNVLLVLEYVGSRGGNEETVEPVLTITPANKQTSFLKNYFTELTVNYSDVDGTTTVKTLADLINEDYEIDIGDEHVIKENFKLNQLMVAQKMANYVPVKISKEDVVYAEYTTEIGFEGLKIGYVHNETDPNIMADDDLTRQALLKSSLKLLPILYINYGYSELLGEILYFRWDLSNTSLTFNLYDVDGTYRTVTASEIMSANWTVLYNDNPVGAGSDIAFDFSSISDTLEFPMKVKLQIGGEYLSTSDEFTLEAPEGGLNPADFTGVTNLVPNDVTVSFATNYLENILVDVTYRTGSVEPKSLYDLINDGFEVIVGETSVRSSNYDEEINDLMTTYAGYVPVTVNKNGYTAGQITAQIGFEGITISPSFFDSRHDVEPDILNLSYAFETGDFEQLKLRPVFRSYVDYDYDLNKTIYNYYDFVENNMTYYKEDGTKISSLSLSDSADTNTTWTIIFNDNNDTRWTTTEYFDLTFKDNDYFDDLEYPIVIKCNIENPYFPVDGLSCEYEIANDGTVDLHF